MARQKYPVPRGRPTKHVRVILAERQREVARLYARGLDQYEIGERLGIPQPVVSRDLTAVRKSWLASSMEDWATVKAAELAKIDATEAEAWAAWERSKRDAESITEKEEVSERNGEVSSTVKTRKGQCGDPRFLEVIAKCREQRCKIFGLYQDVNILSVADGGPVVDRIKDLVGAVDAQLAAGRWSSAGDLAGTPASEAVVEGTMAEGAPALPAPADAHPAEEDR